MGMNLSPTKQNSEKKKDWRGQPHQYQRIHDWVEDSQNWAYGDDPPQRDTGGRGAKSKLHRYRMKQNRVSGEQQNLAPRQQRAQEQRASESTAKKSWKHVKSQSRQSFSNVDPDVISSKRYAPPRLQKRQTMVDRNSSDWAKNTSLKDVLAVAGNFYPEGVVDFYEKFNDNIKCELKSGSTRNRSVGSSTDTDSGPGVGDFVKNYLDMANFMRYQFAQWQYQQNQERLATTKAEHLDICTTEQSKLDDAGKAGDVANAARKEKPRKSSQFNDIVKSTTGHDMDILDMTGISLGASMSPLSATTPSENSSLPSELWECCATSRISPQPAQSTAKKLALTKEPLNAAVGRNIHPNSPYYRRICNIPSPFNEINNATAEKKILVPKSKAPEKATHPFNSSLLSNGQAAGTTFNSQALQSSGYASGMMDSKNTTAEFGNVRARNDCMSSSTNNSSNLLIGDSVLGENSNIIRKVVENDKDLILKKSYGEFYCRGCDRSWCSKNVWVVCNSRRVYIKRTCNQCHKVIEPWYLAK